MIFDKDFLGILKEEYTKVRITNLLRSEPRYFELKEMIDRLEIDKESIAFSLQEMVKEGMISRVHRDGVAKYLMRS